MSLAEDLRSNPREQIGHNNPPKTRQELLAETYADTLAKEQTIIARAEKLPAKVQNEDELLKLGEVIKDARKLAKAIDEDRKTEVKPHLEAQREINGFMNAYSERLEALAKRLEDRATDFQRAKAAEERRRLEDEARRAREEQDRQRDIAEAEAQRNRLNSAAKHEDKAEEAAENAARAEVAAQASAAELTRVRSSTGTIATSKQSWDFAIDKIENVDLEKLRPYLARDVLEKAIRAFVRMGGRELAGVRIFQDTRASFR